MRGEIYFDEKQRKKRRRILKLKIYGGIAAFFVLLIGAGYLIVYSPLFRITRIYADFTQNNAENKEELFQNLKDFFAKQSKTAEFLGPENILIWKQEKIGEFLKSRPEIAEITIKKDYFKRQIEIKVKERERFGIWCQQMRNDAEQTQKNAKEKFPHSSASVQHNSAFCGWFDKNGILFAETLNVEGQLINKVADFSNRQLKLGDKALDDKFFQNLIKIFEFLEKSGLRIKSLKLENLELQEVKTESSPIIYFSLRFAPDSAFDALKTLKNKGLKNIEYIDLRIENRVFYRPFTK
jgi:hypothetical protein